MEFDFAISNLSLLPKSYALVLFAQFVNSELQSEKDIFSVF